MLQITITSTCNDYFDCDAIANFVSECEEYLGEGMDT